MLAVLDSGEGGRLTLAMLRRFVKKEDITLLMDTENCPYGEKSPEELLAIVKSRVKALRALGARLVLLGCCTASTVYPMLPEELRRVTLPIIRATALRAVSLSENGRIALLATEATVSSGAFDKYADCLSLSSLAAPELVRAVESGECDLRHAKNTEDKLDLLLSRLCRSGEDTLILGCTHFPALERTAARLAARYGVRHTVSSVREGAILTLALMGEEYRENGRDIILQRI